MLKVEHTIQHVIRASESYNLPDIYPDAGIHSPHIRGQVLDPEFA